jgi:protein-tyrosine phosphatase
MRQEQAPGGEALAVDPGPSAFGVLAVCRANHCRSPLIEHVLRQQGQLRGLDWNVTSAGIQADAGVPMHQEVARILSRRGIATTGWASRPLLPELVRGASLVLTASEAHRAAVLSLEPRAMSRVFTLRQFAHLVRVAPERPDLNAADYGPWLVQQADRQRSWAPAMSAAERNLPDPMGHSARHFRACARLVDQAVADILARSPQAGSARR